MPVAEFHHSRSQSGHCHSRGIRVGVAIVIIVVIVVIVIVLRLKKTVGRQQKLAKLAGNKLDLVNKHFLFTCFS